MKSHREILTQRYLDKTITTGEMETLIDMLTKDGPTEEDELFLAMEIELRTRKTFTQEDREHVANNLFYEREGKAATVPMYRSGKFVWWSAAAAAVVAIGLAWHTDIFNATTTSGKLASVQPVPDTVITISTGNNTKFVLLPDSSTVLLNENSSITYTRRYGYDTREVSLTGEGFFDVAHSLTPFRVKTGRLVTDVLGTAFNIKVVKDPSNGDKYTVTVSRGKVAVRDENQSYGTLTPNEQIDLNTDNNVCVRTKVNATLATAWTSQFIIINNLRLEDVVAMLSERFHVKIMLENQDIRSCKITSAFLEKPKLETVLRVVTAVINATYSIDNKTGKVTISGGECKQS